MPGRVEHDGADLAGEDRGGPLLFADDHPAGEHLVAGLHHAQPIVGDVDQHVAGPGELIHQVTSPQVAQQQAGAHLGPGVEPAAGLPAYDAVGGQAMAALELLDRLQGVGVVGGVIMARGRVTQLVEDGADLTQLRGDLAGSQGWHGQGRPLLGHGQRQQLAHFLAHRLVFRDLGSELFDLFQQVVAGRLVSQRLVQIEFEGLHLLAGDQIHGAPGLLEPGQLAKRLVIEGATLICRLGLQLLPERIEIRVQLGQHGLLQLLLQLLPGLLRRPVLIPVVLLRRIAHHHLAFAGLCHGRWPAAQPDQVCQCQPILLPHAYLKIGSLQSVRPGGQGAHHA